jgi:hypothetical protein
MLGFCDQVVVVDGGSQDGTRENIEKINDPRLRVIVHEWDWAEPGMDGMQKAVAKNMEKTLSVPIFRVSRFQLL